MGRGAIRFTARKYTAYATARRVATVIAGRRAGVVPPGVRLPAARTAPLLRVARRHHRRLLF